MADAESVLTRYSKAHNERMRKGIGEGLLCEYCGTLHPRIASSARTHCSRCGAPMREPICWIYGIPCFDSEDAAVVAEYFAPITGPGASL